MIYVVDAHAVIWFLEHNDKLSATAARILRDPSSTLVVPTIALAEIWHRHGRGKIATSLTDAMAFIDSLANCEAHPFDVSVLNILPSGLEIHDAIIVATALAFRSATTEVVAVLTVDRDVTASGLVDVVW